MRRFALSFAFAMGIIGCGGAAPAVTAPPTVAGASPTATAPPPVVEAGPRTSIARSSVRKVLKSGLGTFLQSVVVDGPVFLGGKFHGFRIAALKGKDWQGVDLKPGDVVTRVNGFVIERPEAAFEAFQSLEVASELRVDLEREGEPRSLRYAIVDD